MANHSAGGEEIVVERQLELHLEEQKESISELKYALVSDPANPELIAVLEELETAIKDAEEGLFHLKRSRLLKEADALLVAEEFEHFEEAVKTESFQSEIYSVGSKCRFRLRDGRWYNGLIVALDGGAAARISFLTPTSESMLMCKFFLQQRCRFGSSCRMSHGFSIPFPSIKPYNPTVWGQSLVGSLVWAFSEKHSNIWRRAELESWDDDSSSGRVIFQDDGSSAMLGAESLSISAYADESSDEDHEEDGDSIESSSSDEKDDPDHGSAHQGLGFLEASASLRGVQTETVVFATWEHHTRGIASKMMASMGYSKGMGLGASGQGALDPVSVRVLPAKQSLDHAIEAGGKKRARGGRRRRRKQEKIVTENKEEDVADVFRFINNQLSGSNGHVIAKGVKSEVEDRKALVAHEHELKEMRVRVERLKEMVDRNRKDKAVFQAASRKLAETRRALVDAEASHLSASNAVASKEKEKKWLKF